MDNLKTGAFIKSCRKEKKMTQKELADRLHVTDRAVSKWERGLSAPDIALLEPLASALGVTIVELLSRERMAPKVQTAELDAAAKTVLDYSERQLEKTEKALAKKSCSVDSLRLFLAGACRSHLEWVDTRRRIHMAVYSGLSVCTEGSPGH